MKKIVLDSYPILTLFRRQKGFEKVRVVLQKVEVGQMQAYINLLNWVEVQYILLRDLGAEKAQEYLDKLEQEVGLKVLSIDRHLAERAGKLKSRGNISLPNCFAIVTAQDLGCPVYTGDREFLQFESEVEIEWV